MFYFSIHPDIATGEGYRSISIDAAFAPNDAGGSPISGWTAVYFSIFYLDATKTKGWTYLEQCVDQWYVDQPMTSLGFGNIFGHYHTITKPATIIALIANRGKNLFFLFTDVPIEGTETITYQKLYSARMGIEVLSSSQTLVNKERLDWLRNDVENVLFPRNERRLNLMGENLFVDDMDYDDSGNMTSLRERGFDTTANCAAATVDNVATEEGENTRIDLTQTFSSPQRQRTLHKSVSSVLPDDAGVTVNNQTSVVEAPGNVGDTWPT